MKYVPQSPDACLAYAALSIGAVDGDDVQAFENASKAYGVTNRMQQQWASSVAPWLLPMLERLRSLNVMAVPATRVPELDYVPRAAGVAVVLALSPKGMYILHAVGHDKGSFMDPEPNGPGEPESWWQFVNRWESQGFKNVRLIDYARSN